MACLMHFTRNALLFPLQDFAVLNRDRFLRECTVMTDPCLTMSVSVCIRSPRIILPPFFS